MPYGNKLLSIDQLLAAWQNRNQMENNSSQTAMQQKLAEKQLEAQDLANKKAALEMDLITSPFNIQRERWAGSGNANTPGVDKAISDNQKMQKLSMLTGKNMPNMGITGYGGGWGDRGHGDGGGEIQRPAPGGYEYYGPDHSKEPTTVEAATQLGNIMTGGIPKQEPTIADLMAEEQGNVAGMNSLINQATNKGLGDKISSMGLTNGMTPVTEFIGNVDSDKKAQSDLFLAGGPMPKNLTPKEEIDLRTKKTKIESGNKTTETKNKKIFAMWNKLYAEPEWLAVKDNPALVKELESKLPSLIEWADTKKRPLNPQQIFTNLIRDGKL